MREKSCSLEKQNQRSTTSASKTKSEFGRPGIEEMKQRSPAEPSKPLFSQFSSNFETSFVFSNFKIFQNLKFPSCPFLVAK
ncbi:hypothetical protein A4A49_35184 [Nicotiana attenuata]|uniref:Uncharacterized protein n=1 Tax=Nicotiana attenuata TaxID=49451 RepID=A0A314LFA9_NICAT|nr:hypothetical protein A4A49_35184 [Nicotiana attenuata]